MAAAKRDVLWTALERVLAILMAAMVVLVFVNVVLRYGFSSGLRPAIELSRLGFVWIVMLGAALTLRSNEHLGVAEFAERVMPAAVPALWIATRLVIAGLMAMFVLGCWRQMQLNWANVSQVTGLPTALFYLAGVVGGVLMAAIALRQIALPAPRGPADEAAVVRPVE